MPKIRALGTTIAFGATTIGKLKSIGEISLEADELDVTTLDSPNGYKEYMQGFKDSGEIPLDGYFVKDDPGQLALRTGFGTGTIAQVVVTLPDSTTVTFNAWVKSYKVGPAEVDGVVPMGASLRITGAVAFA